ncbi:hypothetical protein NX775_05075 [Massilia aurea]|uniref:hypothetical protein n=1 Tax=Massilia aurea TaxID=373040 RepID=UPI002161E2E7|nr:hypothetical protein [Massilia aurea]MCS0706470.1 hypothetical protein [Massilia aurea]
MKPHILNRREDFQTALAIDCAVIILKNAGLPQAYAALLANGIPGRIVKRLLSMPNKCRRIKVIEMRANHNQALPHQ